jgi:hypothetical protein
MPTFLKLGFADEFILSIALFILVLTFELHAVTVAPRWLKVCWPKPKGRRLNGTSTRDAERRKQRERL